MTGKRSRAGRRAVTAAAALLAALLVAGCSAPAGEPIAPPVVPAKPDLSTPDSSVRAFLDWTTLAFRMANSDVASKAMDPYEGVRVDSYIQLNREEGGKGMERRLLDLRVRGTSLEGTRALVATTEAWEYRYFSLADQTYVSPRYTASYEATYSVSRDASSGWLVSDVEVLPLGEVR